MKSLICIWIALCFIGCGNSEKKEVLELVKEWNGKEILFPTESYTTVLGKDTFMMEENPEYKVVVYTDSVGCTSCKLQLHRWMKLMHEHNKSYKYNCNNNYSCSRCEIIIGCNTCRRTN